VVSERSIPSPAHLRRRAALLEPDNSSRATIPRWRHWFVAKGIVPSEAVRLAKAIAGEMRRFRK
jgi:hypothetical protein